MINTELHNGDCLEYMKKIPTSSIDLIITDPPYNLGKFMEERDTNLVKMRDNFFGAAGWDDLDYKEWKKSMNKFFHQASRVLKDGGSIIVFMAIIKVETIIQLAQKHGLYYKTTGIWHKSNPMPRNMNLHFVNSTESWIYFTYKTKTGTFNNNGKVLHGVSEYPIATSEDIKTYLLENLDCLKGKNIDDLTEEEREKYFEMRIPANMYIWATMNSADQGVFPMDTAFKRRWEFEYLSVNDDEQVAAIKDYVIGESFLECLDKEQERKKLLETETKIQNNTEELIELYKNQGLTDNVYLSQQDLQSIKKQIKNLEKSKLRLEEMNKAISEIQKEIDYINKDARPKFIRYCKIYIDMKKEHARELRKTGNIQYNKMNEKL